MDNSPVEIAPEPTHPNPRRFYWTKRLAACTVIALVLLSVIILWWRYEARRRLVADLEAYRASVTPLLHAAQRTQRLPDDQNAAMTLLRAGASIPPPPPRTTNTSLAVSLSNFLMSYDFSQAIPAAVQTTADSVLSTYQSQMGLVRIARFQKEIDWDLGNTRVNTQGWNQLNGLLRLKAFQEHLNGHDAEALELLLDQLRLSEANRFYGSQSLVSSTAQTAGAISWDLQLVPNSDSTTQPTSPASRQQVRALIDGLLDDSRQRRDYELGWIRSTLSRAEAALSIKTRWQSRPLLMQPPLAEPLYLMDARRTLREMSRLVSGVQSLDLSTIYSLTTGNYQPQTRISQFSLAGSTLAFSTYRDVVSYFRSLTDRRAAAVQLAARLYALDHQGQFPQNLKDLVPTYLPAIPVDPFAPDGRPLSYVATSPARTYSFGEDRRDNAGTVLTPIGVGMPRAGPFDLVFPLIRLVPTTAPATTSGSSAAPPSQ